MFYLIARQSFICLRLLAIWNDQCFTSTRPARGRSLIKLLKDFRHRAETRIAIRRFRNFRFYLILSRRPSYSFSRLSTQHPTPRILLELHSQFPPRARVKPIARELRDSVERGSPFGKLNPVSNPPGVFPATRLTRRATSRTSVSSFTSLHRNVYAFGWKRPAFRLNRMIGHRLTMESRHLAGILYKGNIYTLRLLYSVTMVSSFGNKNKGNRSSEGILSS